MSYSSDDGSIPDLISLSKIPVNFEQNIETDLLEPVVFNQGSSTQDGFCRFTLQNKGFLHSHSKLFMSVEAGTGVNSGYFNPATGIGQVVKKAVLKIGNKTLNEVSSWDSLHAVKSSLIKNENNVEREFYTSGRFMNHKFQYADGSKDVATRYELDNGYEYDGAHPGECNIPLWAEMDTDHKADSPTYSIDLSDLFPFLKVNQLPLYVISEPINIELTFYPTTGHRIQIDASDTPGSGALIRRSDLKFCADYVYYGQSDEMERWANANKDLSFSFVDYRLVETTISATSLSSGIIRNLGMANRIVPRIITLLSNDSLTETAILTRANSIAPSVNASGVPGAIKYNVRYNDRYEYTSDVDNTARLFSILTDSEGVPFLSRTEYSNERDTIGASTLQGRTQNTNLRGHFFYLGSKLTNGRVGQRGVELHLSGGFSGTSANTMRNFCEYLRVARLSNGMFDVINA
jgi:hypothetical protein